MPFWKKAKQTAIVSRLVEEKIYGQVLREIESGFRRDGLWAKALQKSRGNEQETKAFYIEYRVQSIKDESEIAETLSTEQEEKRVIPDVKPIDRYDEDGYTPLMRAVKAMNIESVIDLLEKGANPKIKDESFGTSTAFTMAMLLLKRAKTIDSQQCYQAIVDALEPVS